MFDRLLLIACICIVVALALYFFYWNRFIAFLIGQAIRILYWNQEASSVWVEIGSIHFSLVAGRILLKDVRYHSSNQTIKIVKGQIQWRYWIRRPSSGEEIDSTRDEDAKNPARLWSCRIQLSFQGVEWFLYNRTAAYDNIIAQMERANRSVSRSSFHRRFLSRFARQDSSSPFYPPSTHRASIRMPAIVSNGLSWLRRQLPDLDPKDLLPLGIHVQTGAIILGNPSTPNLLVAEFQNAVGTYGIVPSRSRYDLHKQVLGLKFQNPLIRLVKNDDYVDSMNIIGALVHSRIKHHSTLRKPSFYQPYRPFIRLWRQLSLYTLTTDYFATRWAQGSQSLGSSLPGFNKSKVADEETPIGIDFSTHEYAIERKILEAPTLELTYYIDVVGEVPFPPTTPPFAGDGFHGIGNGDTPPEWGIDLVISGGVLRYGPWADRQRAELQRAFFPPTYQDLEVYPQLKPGDKRMWAALQVFVELRDETSLYIPFREGSKDWQWDGVVEIPQRPRKREAAFINVTVGDRSSINYVIPMVAGPSGYESTLEVHLDAIAVTSSLNDIRLISGESCRVRGELPAPMSWNAERTWSIAVFLRQPVLFLLRDHINMLTDLGKDWASGPLTDYQKFIPIIYSIKLEMYHFELNLYANDQNIIDKPLIRDENALISLRGPHLKNTMTIPSNIFRPESTSIAFSVAIPDLVANFILPRWNTHALHAQKEGISLFKTNLLTISGSYRYFSEILEDYVEQLKLDVDIEAPVFRAFGWFIRYSMVLRDNYLGSFTHFQTLYEYLDKRRRKMSVGDPIGLKYRPGKANMLQVQVLLRVKRATALIPTSLIGCATPSTGDGRPGSYIAFVVPEIQLQFRMHDYYLEMSLNLDTMTGSIKQDHPMGLISTGSHDIFMIDGIDITANRLFGPQPRTATYVCIWEIAVGDVKAAMSANEAQILAAAVNSFRFNFVDLVNAPADEFSPTVDPDVTFYKLTVKSINLTWQAGPAALLVQLTQGIQLDSNDLGAHRYRKVTSLRIPSISTKVLLTSSMERNIWLEAAEIVLDACIDIYSSPKGHRAMTRTQLAFIEEQDKCTDRAKRMFDQLRQRSRNDTHPDRISHRNGVYLPQPTLPRLTGGLVKEAPTHYARPSRPRPPSGRHSTLANLSDSEGEEGVSEADRDARLARTRTSTPVTRVQEDDMTMSSGDESDDADLTDGDSSGDDWSDISEQASGSFMSFYSPITRHYAANRPEPPEVWEGSFFIPIRGNAPFIRRDLPTDTFMKSVDSDSFISPEDVPKDENLTTFRVKCRNAVRIIITPLVLPASVQFEEDVKTVASDPEMCIDSLLAACILKSSSNDAPKSSIIDLALRHITLLIIQHVAMSDDGHPNVFKAMQSPTIPSSVDIAGLIDAELSGVSFLGIFTRNPPVLKASLDRFSCTLDVSMDRRTLTSALPNPTIFQSTFSSSSVHLSHRNLRANMGAISIEIGHRAPELVTATCIAVLSTGSQILRIAKGFKPFRLEAKRTIVGNILKTSEHKPIIDPLSTIQPSYLVQTGKPHLLRTDVSFRFLYHLRNCIWVIGSSEYATLQQSQILSGMEDLISSAEARLALLDPDAFSISHLTSMDPLFFDSDAQFGTKALKSGVHSIDMHSIQLTKATFTVLATTDGSSSELIVKNLGIDVQSKSLDLVQFNFSNPSGASQTSFRSKSSKMLRKMIVILSLGDTTLIIAPHLMHFAQHVLRVKKQFASALDDASSFFQELIEESSNHSSRLSHTEVISVIHRLRIQAAAENLVVVMGMNGIQTSTALLVNSGQRSPSMTSNILFNEIYLQARSPANPAKESEQDILAAVTLAGCRFSAVSRPESEPRTNLKLVFGLASLRIHVPRSALRLYRFIQEWRADYLPGIEATINTLFSEYKSTHAKPLPLTPSCQSPQHPIVQVHGQVDHFEISLQVMHGTWLSWEVHNTVAYFHSPGHNAMSSIHAFGLQIASMVLNVSSKPNAKDVAPSSRVKLMLPPLSLAGHSNENDIHMQILFSFIDLKVKPSHWDTLLAVQQKFGQDFNDLVGLMHKTRQKPRPVKTPIVKKKSNSFYVAHLKMQGFRIGLEGLSSIVFLDCQDINGSISNSKGWTWHMGLSDLALSLAPRISGRQSTVFTRNHRSAFVIIDFKISGSRKEGHKDKNARLSITKIHAVMQPSSIGEFGDFVDNLQAEMLERQEQRALELAAFKEKTQSILRTFDVNVGDVRQEQTSLISDLIIGISIRNIGVAFPLTHDEELHLPRSRNKESTAVRAFLFSIKSIDFGTHRGETGQATMRHLSFQFVPRFRQSSPDDFLAEKHQTSNCLVYPEMQAQLRSSRLGPSRKLLVKADVSGFILDIDSSIPNYVFSLIDVYRQGKERVERLSANAPRTPLASLPVVENVKPSLEKHYTAIPTSNVFIKLTFLSGKVRLYSGSASNHKTKHFSDNNVLEISDDQVLALGAEVFNLPVVSVWAEYRATPASQKLSKTFEQEPSILMFNSTVFSSQNTLRPTLLPFMTELVDYIETRMRKDSSRTSRPPSALLPLPSSTSLPEKDHGVESVSSMQISFSLRIDKSKLELTCQPDVNVVAGLHWESGGFLINVSPGARKVSFSGSVGGLVVGLKHGFLSEDCVKLHARNLAFSVSFTKSESGLGDVVNSISIVLDTEFLGGVRFSRLQDILCFKAVWLDRIPIFNNQTPSETKTPLRPTFSDPVDTLSKRGFSTVILLRVRQIALEIDLGSSITRINLDLHQTVFRTKLTDALNEVFFYVADVRINAQGNLSGHARVASCVFQTIRRSEGELWDDSGRNRMLELRLTSGALFAVLESDNQGLLQYHAAPLEVEIFDDWSQRHSKVGDDTRPLQLSFTINSPEVVAVATVGTIPKFLSYMNKFKANLDAQRQGASRESQTFRVTRTPKPENPLSAVAEAMLHSARNRFKEAESGLSFVIRQHMSLRLDLLRLIVFPRTMRDVEIAQFIGRDVRARLDGLVGSSSAPAKRDLHLSFSSMIISKYTQVAHPAYVPLNPSEGQDGREWLANLFKDTAEATIVGLPSMKMHMSSEETIEKSSRILIYDFYSEFIRRAGMKAFEDIYITLNMSLYSWLTVLRKNLTREMEQVRATEDWRTSISSVSTAIATGGSQRKKKVPHPLSLNDTPRSATLPSASTIALSPVGPSSARSGWTDSRSPQFSREQSLSPLTQPSPSPLQFPLGKENSVETPVSQSLPKRQSITYKPRNRHIERLTMRQLGEATPDVMHPFFMKKAGFNLEDSLPQYVNEYAAVPLEEIMEVLMKLYSRQLLAGSQKPRSPEGY